MVASMAGRDQTYDGSLGNQLRTIFTDKPENCSEIPKIELTSLIKLLVNQDNEVLLDSVYNDIDENSDGITSCIGKLFPDN